MKGTKKLNKLFENRHRLSIMYMLLKKDFTEFNKLKINLEITDGNLASHLKILEQNKIILVKKQFIQKKPLTTYQVSVTGRAAFLSHINGLEEIITEIKKSA